MNDAFLDYATLTAEVVQLRALLDAERARRGSIETALRNIVDWCDALGRVRALPSDMLRAIEDARRVLEGR